MINKWVFTMDIFLITFGILLSIIFINIERFEMLFFTGFAIMLGIGNFVFTREWKKIVEVDGSWCVIVIVIKNLILFMLVQIVHVKLNQNHTSPHTTVITTVETVIITGSKEDGIGKIIHTKQNRGLVVEIKPDVWLYER